MPTCGYICPQCEGRGFTDDGKDCDWCTPARAPVVEQVVTDRYFALYKPFGYLSQFICEHNNKRLLGDLHAFPEKVMPVGRLDEDSEGLLLLSNSGKFHQHLLAHHVEKEYWVLVEGKVSDSTIEQLQSGIDISHQSKIYHTRPCTVKRLNDVQIPERTPRVRYHKYKPHTWLSISLKEGKYRQVRKMTAAAGHPTLRLVRMRVGGLLISQQMQPGTAIELSHAEVINAGLLKHPDAVPTLQLL
jgi:23S rRNA pseudouridine2457 synthase